MNRPKRGGHPVGRGIGIRARLLLSFLGLAVGLILVLSILIYRSARSSLEGELGSRLESIAAAATTQIDPSLVAPLLSLGAEGGERTRTRLGIRFSQLRDVTSVRRIFVLDIAGRVRLDTDPDAILGSDLPQARAHRAMLERVARGETASSPLFRTPNGEVRKTGYAPMTVSREVVGFVGVEADARFLSEVRRLAVRLAGIALVGFVAAALLSFGLARGLTQPIGRLVEAAQALGRGDLDRRIPLGRPDEIGFLARTLDEARVRLSERDRSLRAMVAGIAHEVRNPLGGIQIYAELLENDPGLSDSQRERVRKVIREIHRLEGIVEEFLAYARPQAPELQAVDPTGIVQETVELLGHHAVAEGVEILVDPPAEPVGIHADPGQVRQVLLNLVRNAIEASPEGGQVRIAWMEQGPTVALSVDDDGPGIALEQRERVFEPFYTTKAEGAGLGLSIVRHLTEQNGGRVTLERADGGGCRFTIRFERDREVARG